MKKCKECYQIMNTGYGECLEHNPDIGKMIDWREELVKILPLQHATLEVHNILIKFISSTIQTEREKALKTALDLIGGRTYPFNSEWNEGVEWCEERIKGLIKFYERTTR